MPPQQVTPDNTAPTPSSSTPGYHDRTQRYLVLTLVFGFLTLVFLALFVWALMGKNNAEQAVEERISQAVSEAREDQKQLDAAAEQKRRESNTRTFSAGSIFGNLQVDIPKPWSLYVEKDASGKLQLDAYAHPNAVTVSDDEDAPFALRFTFEDTLYQDEIASLNRTVEQGDLSARAVTVAGAKGTRFKGEIDRNTTGHMVVLPVRDKTVKLWTEGSAFTDQFNTILNNVSLNP